MPRVVDAEERRTEIASAALGVAREHGMAGVTFRSVATAMGATSTTVVTHYARNRSVLVGLMMKHLFHMAEEMADAFLPTLAPAEGLQLLTEAVLPTSDESRMLASLVLDATIEFGFAGEIGDELEGWGDWLRSHIRDLVDQVDHPAGMDVDAATDAIAASLAGITLYGLVDSDNWSSERQRRTLATLMASLGLD